MRVLNVLIVIIIGSIFSAFSEPTYTSNPCTLEIVMTIDKKKVSIQTKSGNAPFKFIFLERTTGKLLNKDFALNSIDGLKKGDYKCLIVDVNGCSKQVEFEIQ